LSAEPHDEIEENIMNDVYERAEIDYRREQLSRTFAAAQRVTARRRGLRRHRERLMVVPPYGDARA
jgi:hypothetical protein